MTVNTDIDDPGGLATGSQIDLSYLDLFGQNWGMEIVEAVTGSKTPGLIDVLISPFGDYIF